MNNQKTTALLLFLMLAVTTYAQDQDEDQEYITFNDRNNVVHGVYLGIPMAYGEMDGKDTYFVGLKLAYVANRQLEVGIATVGFYSQQNLSGNISFDNEDLIGGYVGLHLEPILFGRRAVSLSFPQMIGAGAVGYVDGDTFENDDHDFDRDDLDTSDVIFVYEPGISALFNISRYVQLEASGKYRFSSKIQLEQRALDRINGFSVGMGVKVGIFNMGRNRYKKQLN